MVVVIKQINRKRSRSNQLTNEWTSKRDVTKCALARVRLCSRSPGSFICVCMIDARQKQTKGKFSSFPASHEAKQSSWKKMENFFSTKQNHKKQSWNKQQQQMAWEKVNHIYNHSVCRTSFPICFVTCSVKELRHASYLAHSRGSLFLSVTWRECKMLSKSHTRNQVTRSISHHAWCHLNKSLSLVCVFVPSNRWISWTKYITSTIATAVAAIIIVHWW